MNRCSEILCFCGLMLLAACGENTTSSEPRQSIPTGSGANIVRNLDQQQVSQGRDVFLQNCSRCHGRRAQGAKNWRQRGADGMLPPPPLNGTGHAWHHSKLELKHVIRFGSEAGKGNMPAWKDKLSNDQIEAVLVFLFSLWPDEVYAAWHDMHGQ